MGRQIWQGVFPSFAATGSTDQVFEDEAWLQRSWKKLHETRARGAMTTGEFPLPILAALAATHEQIGILDFGGGLGVLFPAVADALPAEVDLDFHIVDNASTCRMGRKAFAGEGRIHFYESLPEELGKIHIVHLGSVLQYVEDWRGLLHRLAQYGASYLLISDAMVGDIPTFITVQNYYNRRIPFQFLNLEDLLTYCRAELGYRLVFKTGFIPTVQGKQDFYDMDNLPPGHRLRNTQHLLFRK